MSTNPSPLKSPGSWISVVRMARLLVSIGSIFAVFWSTVTTLLVVVPLGVPTSACTVSVNVAVAPDARGPAALGRTQSTRPTPPTGGVLQVHAAGAPRETNVISGGVASVIEGKTAACGPLFVTVIVWVIGC